MHVCVYNYVKKKKKTKRHPEWKGKVLLTHCFQTTLSYIWNLLMNPPKKTVRNNNKFSKVQGYKVSVQNQLYFYALVLNNLKIKKTNESQSINRKQFNKGSVRLENKNKSH